MMGREGISMAQEADTRERLLDVAERMFSEQGYEATSGRQITMEANANIASIHYHFGGKKELLGTVLERRQAPINQARLQRLEQLSPDASVEEVLAAFLEPALFRGRHADNPTARISRLVGRLLIEKPKDLEDILTRPFVGVLARFLDALCAALPDVSRPELFMRLQMVVGVLIHVATGLLEARVLPDFESPVDDDEALLRPVIAFLAAGFRAPPTMEAVSVLPGGFAANGESPAA
jgi:AcrR family transcriptional regulator